MKDENLILLTNVKLEICCLKKVENLFSLHKSNGR